jgi:UDP:flavonoid glycosyltransferase YjiC (YdhE family)
MRVLFATPPAPDRLRRLAPLAWALRVGGHEALVAAEPGFAGVINQAGLVAVAAGPDGAGLGVEQLAAFCSAWQPDVVIWDQGAPGGADAARAVGAASVCLRGTADRLAPVAADLVVDTTLPSLRGSGAGDCLPMRHQPYDGGGVVPSWLGRRPRRDRVYVHHAASPGLLAAVGRLDAEVICAAEITSIPDHLDIPDNVRILDAVGLNVLLPSCSAVLHAGQPEAVAAAVHHGLPQLDVSSAEAELLAGIERLLHDPDLRAAAQRLRAEAHGMPAPSEVAAELSQRFARRGSRVQR